MKRQRNTQQVKEQDTAAAAAKLLQSCLTLSDPMDFSLPGSSIHGTFQARVLEWGAIAFSMEQDKCPPNQTKEEEIGNLPN